MITALLAPLKSDHWPIPLDGTFPFNAVLVWLHIIWSAPASKVTGLALIVTVAESEKDGQTPFVICHSKIYVPGIRFVTLVEGLVEDVIAGLLGPEITFHIPFPKSGLFPFSEIEFALQRFWSRPADAEEGRSSTVTSMVSEELGQFPFEVVHINS